jgi:adenosylcobyric acid synthase
VPNLLNKTLMIQGTTSDAGKSTLVTGLCRLFARQGIKVAPFKPQNMALNSAVTADGGEIGRAQAVQAKAAFLPAEVDFNPVLLKPNSDTGAQVIIHGKAISAMEAAQYQDYKAVAMNAVLQSHQRLCDKYQLIVVEGAGSPAEINLRAGDIANMGFAEAVDCPVIIIADIDKGGVFAHLVGTLALLSESEQARVIGFVINRFRGDLELLKPGLTWLEQKTNKPVLGVLPYLHNLAIASEDGVAQQQANSAQTAVLTVLVLVLPHMSNHTDFDALRANPEFDCRFVYGQQLQTAPARLPACDLIILPGSKNVRGDLAFLREQGWHNELARHLRYGGKVFGICGGFQMLGQFINDPLALEGAAGSSQGLGYLPMVTELQAQKTLCNVSANMRLQGRTAVVTGYEIHAGQSQFLPDATSSAITPLLMVNGEAQGAVTIDGQIAGCYLHGLFDSADALTLLAHWLGAELSMAHEQADVEELAIEQLADCCQQHLAVDNILQLTRRWHAAAPENMNV